MSFFRSGAGRTTSENTAGFRGNATKCCMDRSTSTNSRPCAASFPGRSAGAAGLTTRSGIACAWTCCPRSGRRCLRCAAGFAGRPTHGARVGEGYGVVLAEAMASRLPVVTLATPQRKKCNAQAEVVEHNVTGFVCRFTWQYADAVIELLENHALRERFAERGYEKAREQFEASRLTRKLEALYTELMDMGNA
ncbi:MAG: glycosyltransferase [Nitrospirae bacterium]|nr:MAG: glycosyltransferase [Nitrospirota bacterium]